MITCQSTMLPDNCLRCVILIITVFHRSWGREMRYRRTGSVEGALPGVSPRERPASLARCAEACHALHTCGCPGFVYQTPGRCVLATEPEDIPLGTWGVYGKKCSSGDVTSRVVVRRVDGSVDFYQTWADYKAGFGNPGGEIWLGLDALHERTSACAHCLRVDVHDWEGRRYWSEHAQFSVAAESYNFRLFVSGYNPASSAGDGLTYHSDSAFSTRDRDNDVYSGSPSCAQRWEGGFWYSACHHCNPTGQYLGQGQYDARGLFWCPLFDCDGYSFKTMIFTMIPW